MNLPDLSATGIIAIVVLAFAVIGFLKGLIRTVLAMVCLGISGYAALWAHEHASDLTGPWISNPGPWLPKAIAVLTGVIIFILLRQVLHFLIDPFDHSTAGKRIGFGLPAAALSLCSGLAILWLSFIGIRYGGSLAQLRYIQHQTLQNKATTKSASEQAIPLLMKAKRALDASSIGKWHQKTDPLYQPGKIDLCKILILYHHSQSRQKLLRHGDMNKLLNARDFLNVAYNEQVKINATTGHPRALFSSEEVNTLLKKTTFMKLLDKVNLDSIIKN